MKDSNRPSSCSSSLTLLLVVIPLVLVSGFVCIVSPNTSWLSLSYRTATGIPSSSSSSSSAAAAAAASTSSSLSPKESERRLDLIHQMEKTLSDASFTMDRLDEKKLGKSKSLVNGSDIVSVMRSVPKGDSKFERVEAGLARARAAIREAARNLNQTPDVDYVPQGPTYWNAHAFHRSYLEMEQQFKVFIYEEGEPPLFHNGPCKSIYSMEGNFIHGMEVEERFRTRHPEKAHVYFLPFSVAMMVQFVYVHNSHDIGPIKRTVIDYINVVADKYPFWNRSLGADHFMLSCHDWGPITSTYVTDLCKNSIRVLCNANTSEGFNPSKDASVPEINLQTGEIKGWIGGPSPSHRTILAFFAGGLHGPIRPILLEHWKNKDEVIQVHEYLPKGTSYYDMMKKSKFCICPSGYEVASPRIVEAIYTGCVPVLISDHYVLPFSDVLNWKSFSVEVQVHEIPNLKKILMGISQQQYIRMQRRGVKVRRHFEVNAPPKRYDVFHMILHSIWLRRLNVRIHDKLIHSGLQVGTMD